MLGTCLKNVTSLHHFTSYDIISHHVSSYRFFFIFVAHIFFRFFLLRSFQPGFLLRHHEMLPSFGARADRIMQLLLVPAVGAVTSAAQMFMPGATPSL